MGDWKLDAIWKKAAYIIGMISSVINVYLIPFWLIMYLMRDKKKKCPKDTLVFSYQKFIYVVGCISFAWLVALVAIIFSVALLTAMGV